MNTYILCFLLAFVLSCGAMPKFIVFMRDWNSDGQPMRELGPESHLETKRGTPTMGGAVVLASFFICAVIFSKWYDAKLWIVLFISMNFAALGFLDDYVKVSKQKNDGISGNMRLAFEFIIAFFASIVLYFLYGDTSLILPFFHVKFNIGILYIPFSMLVIVGSANAVNLADGLDGLVSVPVILCAGSLGYLAHTNGMGNISILCAALMGSVLGFLWFNALPAQIFMGDIGSLFLGGALGAIAIVTKNELVFAILGMLFVVEALSVVIQVSYFKYTKNKRGEGVRIFLMAPIHHHFEKMGWPESKVVARFWIFSAVCVAVGLLSVI